MNELWLQWQSKWYQWSPRERRTVALGGGFFAVLMVVSLIFAPAQSFMSDGAEARDQAFADLVWLREQATVLEGAGSAVEGQNQSLFTIANLTVRDYGLKWSGSEPNDQGGLRLRFEKAEFNRLVRWVAHIRERFGVQVKSIQLDQLPEPGLVDVRMELVR